MAKDKKPAPGEQPPQEEMTVVVLKFKGGAQSLQKGFDTVSQAIAALGGPVPANNHRPVTNRPAAQLAAADTIIDADAEDVTDTDETPETEAAAPPPAAPKIKKSYTFMNDFNLSPAGVPSLAEYCGEKDPQTDVDKFLVASAWVQTHGGADPFSAGHLFTAFRAMDWKTQADMTQPLRNLKLKKSYYENPTHGKWKLTGPGLKAAAAIVKA
jgi:hypothetical protein